MRRTGSVRGALVAAVLVAACASRGGDAVRVGVAPAILAPHDLLDGATKLTLRVYAASDGVACGTDGGTTGDTSKPIATKDLASVGCPLGAAFCGDLQIVESPDDRIFAATALGSQGTDPLALGCAKAKVDQDALPVRIRMQRFIRPSVCGNGIVEPTEQCEPPPRDIADPLCDGDCHTRELLLSGGHGTTGTTSSGKAGDKQHPYFLWPAQSGTLGRFVAVFGDRTPGQFSDVTVRVLDASFQRFGGQGDEFADYSFYLPNQPTGSFPPPPSPDSQGAPVAAAVGPKYYVAFEDDAAGSIDVHLRSLDSTFTAEQSQAIAINGDAGEPGVQSEPAMAASSRGVLYIVWQDEAAGAIRGRTIDPQTKALGAQHDVSSGASNRHPSVASNGDGWIVVWESGQEIHLRRIGADGAPIAGSETKVNDATHTGVQAHPSVAALYDGRAAVVWNDRTSTDVFVQRYDAAGAPVAGDQAARINDAVSDGDQTTPVVASSAAAGGAFAAAWLDAASGHVRARWLGASRGFLFNNVDGQNGEFQASIAPGRARANPVLVVGGAGPYLVVGWEDNTADAPGIYGRRFPVP